MNLKNNYFLIFRKVKHPRIEVHRNAVKIIVPKINKLKIQDIIQKHKKWIDGKVEELKEMEILSHNLILYNHEKLKDIVEKFVNEFSKILRVKPEEIFFRKMKRRWGSCKPEKKKLIFSRDLKYLPEDLIKYVVLHEMCHLIVRNHKKEFWVLVGKLES